jgi:hypothetical protein
MWNVDLSQANRRSEAQFGQHLPGCQSAEVLAYVSGQNHTLLGLPRALFGGLCPRFMGAALRDFRRVFKLRDCSQASPLAVLSGLIDEIVRRFGSHYNRSATAEESGAWWTR